MNASSSRNIRGIALGLALSGALALGTSGCGGSGGSSTGATLTGLVLVNFHQASEDNLPLNRILQFDFSSVIDPVTIDYSSIQIRQGPAFGLSVEGRYIVQGATVYFEPKLPGLCSLSDGGFKPDLDYHVTLIGSPEEFAIRNLQGKPLQATVNAAFHTRIDTDPNLFEDQIPGSSPTVVSHSPVDGAWPDAPSAGASTYPEVYIGPTNKVVIDFSENVDPCSITQDTVTFYQYATGNQPTMPNGFLPGGDVTPGDPFTWGSGTATSPPRRVRSTYVLTQSFLSTHLEITPVFGEFPDNALLVVQATNQVKDFGGHNLVPTSFAFVTENRPVTRKSKVFEFNGDVPVDVNNTTADVNTSRAVGKVQGFVLFAGDSDNGTVLTRASGPDNTGGPAGCTTPAGIPQVNDGNPDDFDTLTFGGDVNLDTGATQSSCVNRTDGSTAVTFEFRTFHIRNGHTVRIIGVNPAIILVNGDALIDSGARLLVRGDSGNGSPQGTGQTGAGRINSPQQTAGGIGVGGAGSGGIGDWSASSAIYSFNGLVGYGSPDYDGPPFNVAGTKPAGKGGTTDPTRQGQGRGAVSQGTNYAAPNNNNQQGASGGGGGHAGAGNSGTAFTLGGTIMHFYDNAFTDGAGGGTYGALNGKMFLPEAGSGGGGGGDSRPTPFTTSNFYVATGGGGGAGGGFVDITAKGNISVFGTLDAAGGRGGAGGVNNFYMSGGGGGGGSGGGVRLLSPAMITLTTTTVLTAGGGAGGGGGVATAAAPTGPANNGGSGGPGRLVLEDADSVIAGYASAQVIPPDGAVGFYRGLFDSTRFQGGGLQPQMVTGLIDMGPTLPTYSPVPSPVVLLPTPIQNYGVQEDFIAGLPLVASRGVNSPGIFIEMQGFPAKPDGTADLLSGTGWKSVGYFTDSGSELFPTWVLGTPAVGPAVTQIPTLPQGNTGGSIANINGREFIKFRVTFYLKLGTGPFDPGPYIDRWTVNFTYDQ